MIGGDITDELSSDEEVSRGLKKVLSHKYQNFKRAAQITGALSKYGFTRLGDSAKKVKDLKGDPDTPDDIKELTQAIRFRLMLESLGPTFVKLGQMLSTRPDLIDEEIAEELGNLRDRVPPEPIEVVRRIIEKELGAPVDQLFDEFPDEPMAAASIGMVFKAKPKGGSEWVAVKVQRPNIIGVIRSDISILKDMSSFLTAAFKSVRRFDPVGAVEEFGIMIVRELDYTLEIRNINRFATNMAEVEMVRVPKVYMDLSTNRVLTMEFVDGVAMDKLDQMEGVTLDPKKLVRPLTTAFIKQIFIDGYFHADPHHANILADRDGTLVLIDMGAVGYLEGRLRREIADFYMALMKGDEEKAAESIIHICGASRGDVNISRLALDIRDYMDYLDLRKQGVELDKGINQNAVTLLLKNNLHPPTSFVLLERAMIQIQGVVKTLDPSIDYMNVASENVGMMMKDKLLPDRDPVKRLLAARATVDFLQDLPTRADRILRKVENDKLKVTVEMPYLDDLRKIIRKAAIMVSISLMAFAILLSSVVADVQWVGPIFGVSFTATIIFIGWTVSMIILWRWL
jgi:ubiquinone biosynthesis protein